MKKAIIVDLDGTVCKNVSGRPWFGSAELMLLDEPEKELMNMIREYCTNYDLALLILTGRHKGDEERITMEWLDKNWFYPDKIFTRNLKDFSKSVVYKEKVYEEQIKPFYEVVMVFEDNNACVQMFRDKGLLVLQPQNSNY